LQTSRNKWLKKFGRDKVAIRWSASKALGLTVPPTLLARAGEAIERRDVRFRGQTGPGERQT